MRLVKIHLGDLLLGEHFVAASGRRGVVEDWGHVRDEGGVYPAVQVRFDDETKPSCHSPDMLVRVGYEREHVRGWGDVERWRKRLRDGQE